MPRSNHAMQNVAEAVEATNRPETPTPKIEQPLTDVPQVRKSTRKTPRKTTK